MQGRFSISIKIANTAIHIYILFLRKKIEIKKNKMIDERYLSEEKKRQKVKKNALIEILKKVQKQYNEKKKRTETIRRKRGMR